jgi:hypothetical protein
VYIVESLARHFSEAGRAVLINHRDL